MRVVVIKAISQSSIDLFLKTHVGPKTARVPHGRKTGFGHRWRKRAGTNQEFVPAPLRATSGRSSPPPYPRPRRSAPADAGHSLSLAAQVLRSFVLRGMPPSLPAGGVSVANVERGARATSDERKHVRGASRKARYARASGGLTVFFRPRSITYWDTALCKQGWTGIDRPSGQAPRLGSGGEQTLPGC